MPLETKTDLARLRADLKTYADIAAVKFNDRAVDHMLDLFGDLYVDSCITVRTTTERPEKRDVNFRYMTPYVEHNPVARLREAGVLEESGRPVDLLTDEVIDTLPVWWGVDVSLHRGFQKVWPFFHELPTLHDVLNLKHIPDSLRRFGDRLDSLGLDKFAIMALDFRNETMNLYTEMLKPGRFDRDQVISMIGDVEDGAPSEEEVARNRDVVSCYYTFDWRSDSPRRLCFAMTSSQADYPTQWHPLAKRFCDEAPVLYPEPQLIFNTTYGSNAGYLKLEADYTGNAGSDVFNYWDRDRENGQR